MKLSERHQDISVLVWKKRLWKFKLVLTCFFSSWLQTHQIIRIPIVNDMVFERDEMFEVILSDPSGGAKVGNINRTAITITNDDGQYTIHIILRKNLTMKKRGISGIAVTQAFIILDANEYLVNNACYYSLTHINLKRKLKIYST